MLYSSKSPAFRCKVYEVKIYEKVPRANCDPIPDKWKIMDRWKYIVHWIIIIDALMCSSLILMILYSAG